MPIQPTLPTQPALPTLAEPLAPLTAVDRVCGGSLEQRFSAFHAANPHVYRALRSLALQMRRRGARRIAVAEIYELLRMHYRLQTQGDDYRLNNSWRAFYARLLDQEPELNGCFELRTQRWQHAL